MRDIEPCPRNSYALRLLYSFNDTDFPYDDSQTVISLFRKSATDYPDNTAVAFEDKRHTYRETDYSGEVLLLKDIPSLTELSAELPEVKLEDLFILLYTSGNTGTPKGVRLTHAFITTQVGRQFAEYYTGHSLKYLYVGGEKLALVSIEDKSFIFFNSYGSTETTIFATYCPVNSRENNITIGKALDK